MTDESWIEAAAEQVWIGINIPGKWSKEAIADGIRRHHACPAVTVERLLEQVEAIAKTLRDKVPPCFECSLLREATGHIRQERNEWKQEVTEAMGLLMQVGNSGVGLVKRVARLLEERDEARAEAQILKDHYQATRHEGHTLKAERDEAWAECERLKTELRMHHPTEEIS